MTDVRRSYDDWHRVKAAASHTVESLSLWHYEALRLAPDPRGRRVLEIGCGNGAFAVHVAGKGASVVGVDFSAVAIRRASAGRRLGETGVRFAVGGASALPFAAGSFDLLFSCECLEHVPDPTAVALEMYRVLRPGGTLVLTTENYSNAMILAWLVAWWRGLPFDSGAGVQPIEHCFFFWRVTQILRAAGFIVEQMTGAHHVFLLLPGFDPHTFVKERFTRPFLAWLLRPFARHVAFRAHRT